MIWKVILRIVLIPIACLIAISYFIFLIKEWINNEIL
jgi:CHASE2 domain-containing sensor protein